MQPKLRAKAFRDIELLRKHGGELTEPYVKQLKGGKYKGLYELRIKFSSDIARIFYFTYILRIIRGGTVMSKASVSFDVAKNELMQDEEFRSEYEKLQPRYDIISQIIDARKTQNMTQAELAKLVGTQKSNISRLESGNYNPSLDFLIKVANSLGKNLKIQLQ